MALGLVVLALIIAGCLGGPGNGQQQQAGQDGGNEGDGGGDDEFCPEGQTTTYTNPQTGEQAMMRADGVVTRDGFRTCRWTMDMSTQEGEARMVFYEGIDSDYIHWEWYEADVLRGSYTLRENSINMREYDENGTLIDEITIEGG